jgi:hypothetical protein
MSEPIERLRFYERQYLRVPDWTAEQEYHIAMRRRLNRALHLWGIVEGLEVCKGELVKGAGKEFYVSPGMAIDGFGRELFVAAPKALGAEDFAQGEFKGAGQYKVWAGYRRNPQTPASAGYRLCDAPDQLTRWNETVKIFISNTQPANKNPEAAEAPPDDPTQTWPILLGAVEVAGDASTGPTIIKVVSTAPSGREYIGLRAQHLTSPTAELDSKHPDFPRPLLVEPDLRAQKNLLVGKPKGVDPTVNPVVPPPDPSLPFPPKHGNIFCDKNIFIGSGADLYKLVNDEWAALSAIVPEVQFKTVEVTIPSGTGVSTDPSNATVKRTVKSSALKQVSKATVAGAWIGGVKWNTKSLVEGVENEITNAGGSPVASFRIAHTSITPTTPSSSYEVSLTYAVSPTASFDVGSPGSPETEFRSAIVGLTIVFAVILYP